MTRAQYYLLRKKARTAARAAHHSLRDPHATGAERDDARQWAARCAANVPGGMAPANTRSIFYAEWQHRRHRVLQAIAERKTHARIGPTLDRIAAGLAAQAARRASQIHPVMALAIAPFSPPNHEVA